MEFKVDLSDLGGASMSMPKESQEEFNNLACTAKTSEAQIRTSYSYGEKDAHISGMPSMAFSSNDFEEGEIWDRVICISEKVQKVPNLKIGVLGNCDVGKSSLSQKFALRREIDGVSKLKTTGIDMFNCWLKISTENLLREELRVLSEERRDQIHEELGENVFRLSIWDTGGQEKHKSVDQTYVRGVDGMVLVCDLTNRETYTTISEWCQQVVDIKPMPLIIVGNKVDKENHEVLLPEIEDLVKKFNTATPIKIFQTSAVHGTNVDSAFKYMVYEILAPVLKDIKDQILNTGELKECQFEVSGVVSSDHDQSFDAMALDDSRRELIARFTQDSMQRPGISQSGNSQHKNSINESMSQGRKESLRLEHPRPDLIVAGKQKKSCC